ncbi:bacteriocin-associated integral membrane protein [Streptococcus pneumoniae]|nr:bacteriocin-associated integral membrane protein [Streptococcus pneumoniae]
MKKLFILISNLLASLFFVWVFTIWTDTYVSYYYPNVVVHDSSPETTFQHVATRLEKLAEETDSRLDMSINNFFIVHSLF